MMRRRGRRLLGVVAVAGCGILPVTASAQGVETLTVVIESVESSVNLGDSLDLTVTVSNPSSDQTMPLVVHLDITDPAISTSVDPEDWTSTLSIPIGALNGGESAGAEWTIQPISGGTFAVYAVALASGSDTTSVSNVLTVRVADKRTLNPGGILGAALGVPGFIGLLLVARLRHARAGRKHAAA